MELIKDAHGISLSNTPLSTDVRRSLSNVSYPCYANDTTTSLERAPLYRYI